MYPRDELALENARLRDRVAELEAEKAAAVDLQAQQIARLRTAFPTLFPGDCKVLVALSSGNLLSCGQIADIASRGGEYSGNALSISGVRICNIRRAIAPLVIKTIYSVGYHLESKSLAAIRRIIAGEGA